MTAAETAPGVLLIAARRLKCNGVTYQPGETFAIADVGRAALLVRTDHCAPAPESAEDVARQQAGETSTRIRQAARPLPPISLRDRPVTRPEEPVPTLLEVADLKGKVPHPGLRAALKTAEDRIQHLEALVSELLPEPPAELVKEK